MAASYNSLWTFAVFQSRYAVVWNAHFHHQHYLDFVKHLINVYLLKEVYIKIVYKKTDEWYVEWQRVVQRVTTNDNEWYNEWQRMTTSDNEWYNEWQGMTTSDATSDKEWQRVTTNSNEWQRVTAVVQPMKTAQYTSKNGWLPSFQWQKQIHYYFKGWMAAIRAVK